MSNLYVLVTWQYDDADETSFLLQRSTDFGSTWPNQYPFSLTDRQYIDTNVTLTSSSYSYRVTAINSAGTGSFSNIATVGLNQPPVVSDPIPSIRSSSVGLSISFSVTASGDNNNTTLLTFQWISGSTSLIDNARITGSYIIGGNTSSLVINNLQISDTGYYHVRVGNIIGIVDSNTASLFVSGSPVSPPSPPSSFVVVSGSAILMWVQGSIDTDYYHIEKSIDPTGSGYYYLTSTPLQTYTDTLVTSSVSGSTYWYRVAAVNSAGTSSFSDTASIAFTIIVPSSCMQTVFVPVFFTSSLF